MDNQFSLSQAKKAFQNGNLHNWVQEYLLKEGSNKKLAEHLQNTTVKHIELCEYSLSDLRQVM